MKTTANSSRFTPHNAGAHRFLELQTRHGTTQLESVVVYHPQVVSIRRACGIAFLATSVGLVVQSIAADLYWLSTVLLVLLSWIVLTRLPKLLLFRTVGNSEGVLESREQTDEVLAHLERVQQMGDEHHEAAWESAKRRRRRD